MCARAIVSDSSTSIAELLPPSAVPCHARGHPPGRDALTSAVVPTNLSHLPSKKRTETAVSLAPSFRLSISLISATSGSKSNSTKSHLRLSELRSRLAFSLTSGVSISTGSNENSKDRSAKLGVATQRPPTIVRIVTVNRKRSAHTLQQHRRSRNPRPLIHQYATEIRCRT